MNPIPRLDRTTAAKLDLAIQTATAFNLTTGVKFLHDAGVAPALIQRVLIEGGPRRAIENFATPEAVSALHGLRVATKNLVQESEA